MPQRGQYYVSGYDYYGNPIYAPYSGVPPFPPQQQAPPQTSAQQRPQIQQPIPEATQSQAQVLQQPPQTPQTVIQQVVAPGIQNGDFIDVSSKTEAKNWPMSPGTTLQFKDTSTPFKYYSKSRGPSKFDEPEFHSYTLVEDVDEENVPKHKEQDELRLEVEGLTSKINQLAEQVDKLTQRSMPHERKVSNNANATNA